MHQNRNSRRRTNSKHDNGYPPKVVKRNYHVTSQTAYHITELALREGTSEGRIIDKLMRTYLASQQL